MSTKTNMGNAIESLRKNGFQIMLADHVRETIMAVGNQGQNVFVSIGAAGYCKVVVDEFICTNMAQPYNVGEAARLKRHVGMFENVTMETKV